MATATATRDRVKEYTFRWEGKDKGGKLVKGDMRAGGENMVVSQLRRQGIAVLKVKRQRGGLGGKVTQKDITLFTRQLATMMKAGVPLLQSFDIVGKGHSNPAVGKLLMDIKNEVETGNSLTNSFRKYPLYFDALFCNLVGAGEQAGILDSLLDRLATYKEKILAIKSKIKAALFYPISIIVVAFIITAIIMIFVIPAFKELFSSFGANLPACADAVRDGDFGGLRQVVVGDLRKRRFRRMVLFLYLETIGKNADRDGSPGPQGANLRASDAKSYHCALDADAIDHVRGRRSAGGGAGFGCRRRRQQCVFRSYQEDSAGSQCRRKPDRCNDQHQRIPEHGHTDGVHR